MSLQYGADDVEEDPHAEGGDQQGISTTKGFDEEEDKDGCGSDLHDTVYTRSEQ